MVGLNIFENCVKMIIWNDENPPIKDITYNNDLCNIIFVSK